MHILIIDPDCPKPYSLETLNEEPLGGTEATIARVAHGLSPYCKVWVVQGAREESMMTDDEVFYSGFYLNALPEKDFTAVIVINSPKLLYKVRKKYPYANLYLWVHCFPGKRRKKIINQLALASGAKVLAVSYTLKQYLEDCLFYYPVRKGRVSSEIPCASVEVVYNPVDDGLKEEKKEVDPNKLVYFSSPHKGLKEVLAVLAHIRKTLPEVKLYIANPGYVELGKDIDFEGVEVLGKLKHKEVIRHVREAFCVFYPQTWFRETFGLVFAEANAVGTPVVTHPVGAAREVVHPACAPFDVSDANDVLKCLQKWKKEGRPKVSCHPEFRISKVVQRWRSLLGQRKLAYELEPGWLAAERVLNR
jgi:glycosyltransferase involved in cell wall biosynthesis